MLDLDSFVFRTEGCPVGLLEMVSVGIGLLTKDFDKI